ncbi:hypothetical protein TSYNTROPHJE_01400 [Tepidanaerobacter syntrophicus]|nr:hypothetical protein TSYNTROPHJE_01400 [Tepidanaerobacter syntrophicus]
MIHVRAAVERNTKSAAAELLKIINEMSDRMIDEYRLEIESLEPILTELRDSL